RGGQTKTWQKSMKSLTSRLSHVGRCRLRGRGPRDESHQWLETLNDMAQNRLQWRRCIHSL
ncbi:kinase C-binding 1, partial [Schistosoma japonicum]